MNGPIPNYTPTQIEELRESRIQQAIAIVSEHGVDEDPQVLADAATVLVYEIMRLRERTLTQRQAKNALYATCNGCVDADTKTVLEQLAGVEAKPKK